MSLLSVDDALERIFARIPTPDREHVSLERANGRILLEPLIAQHNQPPFDASAMDGYAVRAADVMPGRPLKLIGTAQAGQHFSGMMAQGQCVRIFTGAPVPIGADAVIMQEEARADGNHVSFAKAPVSGQSIRPAANDFGKGQSLLAAGSRLNPAMLALAASANQPTLSVSRQLRIAVLATGDELVPPGSELLPAQIVASNNYGLAPMLAPYAEQVNDLGTVPDNKAQIETALARAFDQGADIIVTSGGASVGDRDYMQEVLLSLGVTLDFWKINMRPGKPLMFGTKRKTLVFGLPGNPVSAMVTANVLLKPALRRFLGLADPLGGNLLLPLLAPTPANSSRRHFMRGTLENTGGATGIRPISQTDSGHLSSLALADVLIVQRENDPGQPEGHVVEVMKLDKF